jgi:signal transduction histidine kinase
MRWLLYLRLFYLTAGTLLPFFWMVVILGHRRQRNFERVLFFLCLALVCFFGSSLLALNAQLYYASAPTLLQRFAWIFACLGLWMIPALVVHIHVEYAWLRELLGSRWKAIWLLAAYLPAALFSPKLMAAWQVTGGMDFERPTHLLGRIYQMSLVAALAIAAYWQVRFERVSPDKQQKTFHRTLKFIFGAIGGLLFLLLLVPWFYGAKTAAVLTAVLLVLALIPFGLLISNVQRFNFLQIGRQRNLIYAVFGVFLLLLYLSLVRRASQWLDAYLPPEATAALLLFLPLVFFEPLQRFVGRMLQAMAQKEMDVVYRLSVQIQEEARKGKLRALVTFIEAQVKEAFAFEDAWLEIQEPATFVQEERKQSKHGDEFFPVQRPGRLDGILIVRPHGAMISGEAVAAMKFLCESVAGAIDMCLVLEEKVQLERELAERERLALVGQMAASISHNLKNPLGSIKTILQVQMESPELPDSLRSETQMVLEEINRLSARLNQLLQFSRPGVRAGSGGQSCNLQQVAETVANVLRHSADERRVALRLTGNNGETRAAIGEEAANDILSNVLLNAIEAVADGGHVQLSLQLSDKFCMVSVEDDGPGISAADQAKVLQPFFTTKARGTGLGLAIVDRRLHEAGGSLQIKSPVKNGRGTEIRLDFPLERKERLDEDHSDRG